MVQLGIDRQDLGAPCPKCGEKLPGSLRDFEREPDIVCGSCGVSIHMDTEKLRDGVRAAEKKIDDMLKRIRR